MGFDDGVYTIRNVRWYNLMLDLKDDNPYEGATILGSKYSESISPSQKWFIKNQSEPGSGITTISIQSNNDGDQGRGFFAAKKQDTGEQVTYTRLAWLIDCIPNGMAQNNDTDIFRVHFTSGSDQLVLSILSSADMVVQLANLDTDDARQLWQFRKVADIVAA